MEFIMPALEDSSASMEVVSVAALALGMIFVGTAHADITGTMLGVLMESDETRLKSTHARFLSLGLGLLYLGTISGYNNRSYLLLD